MGVVLSDKSSGQWLYIVWKTWLKVNCPAGIEDQLEFMEMPVIGDSSC